MPRLVMSPGGGMSSMPSPWEAISPHLQQLTQTLGRRRQEKQRLAQRLQELQMQNEMNMARETRWDERADANAEREREYRAEQQKRNLLLQGMRLAPDTSNAMTPGGSPIPQSAIVQPDTINIGEDEWLDPISQAEMKAGKKRGQQMAANQPIMDLLNDPNADTNQILAAVLQSQLKQGGDISALLPAMLQLRGQEQTKQDTMPTAAPSGFIPPAGPDAGLSEGVGGALGKSAFEKLHHIAKYNPQTALQTRLVDAIAGKAKSWWKGQFPGKKQAEVRWGKAIKPFNANLYEFKGNGWTLKRAEADKMYPEIERAAQETANAGIPITLDIRDQKFMASPLGQLMKAYLQAKWRPEELQQVFDDALKMTKRNATSVNMQGM